MRGSRGDANAPAGVVLAEAFGAAARSPTATQLVVSVHETPYSPVSTSFEFGFGLFMIDHSWLAWTSMVGTGPLSRPTATQEAAVKHETSFEPGIYEPHGA